MVWTAERVEALTRLWAEGYSARQIADKLGSVTRNAVIGKAHRLNLQRGAIKPVAAPEPQILPPVRHEPPPIFAPEMKGWMCRWQIEDPGKYGLHICGKTVQPGRHYCAEHLTMSYLRRKRTAA
ncbi:MAG: GcrA family cell cycle regulator [Rhodospirillales bacterium]